MKKEEKYEVINGKKVLIEVYPTGEELKKLKSAKKQLKKKQDTRMNNDDFFDWNDSATYC